MMTDLLIVVIAFTLVNLAIFGFNLKIYTEILKEKSQRARQEGS